jgi:hypothetical protein
MKTITTLVLAFALFTGCASFAYAAGTDEGPHPAAGNMPVYFFHQIGRLTDTPWLTNYDAAQAQVAWKSDEIRSEVLHIWGEAVVASSQSN